MAFTFDTTTDRGRVRLLVSDTDTAVAANQIFTDAEIDALLALENNEVFAAAAAGCQSIAASSAKSAIGWKALGEEIDKADVPKYFLALATDYRKRSVEPSEEIDSFDYAIDALGRDKSEYVGDTI